MVPTIHKKTIKQDTDNEVIIICSPTNTCNTLQTLPAKNINPMKYSWRKILKTMYENSLLQKAPKAVETLKGDHIVKRFKGSCLQNDM